mgnify:CR=1 FL=1
MIYYYFCHYTQNQSVMREYANKPESLSRTLDSNPRASRQAPIANILQAYKNGTLGRQPMQRESVEDDELLQAKTLEQAPVSAILQRYKESVQRFASEEENDLLQGKFDTTQREEIDEEEILQGKFESDIQTEQELVQRKEKPNNTGLPDNLKTGIENLSGYNMDDVKVHYNSDKPAQLNALAYAQGTDIHLAPGQEKHLPHEVWHVVQQMQGRVQPTTQLQGVNINNDEGLEKEADAMGNKTPKMKHIRSVLTKKSLENNYNPIQGVWIKYDHNLFVWHAKRNGVEWHYDEETNEMFFLIKKFPSNLSETIKAFYTEYKEQRHQYDHWVRLMHARLGSLEDKDDPLYEKPEFLVDIDSQTKIATLQRASTILRAAGIQVFLGGAASGTLITRTRSIKDLDLRMDGQERDIFNEIKYPDFFKNNIEKPLLLAGFRITNIEKAANTTMRFYINGIEVSITSEPSSEKTLTRGEVVPQIESLGGFDFILDKAAAAADRKDIEKIVTDIFDIIMVRKSMTGNGGKILSCLCRMRNTSQKKVNSLTQLLTQIANTERKYKDERIERAREKFATLGLKDIEIKQELKPIIEELNAQFKEVVVF